MLVLRRNFSNRSVPMLPGPTIAAVTALMTWTLAPSACDHEGVRAAEWNGGPNSVLGRTMTLLTGFRLGMRLFELGSLVPRQRGLRETAAPFLADLFEATHETVHLAILDGAEV